MDNPIADQEASREMAERVFSDPELTDRFRTAAKRTMESDPVPDDFTRLGNMLPSRKT